MLAKYGADPDTRLVLGHHQTNKAASKVYARDVQSAPLRVLEAMFKDIRNGHFRPDGTRSGMIQRPDPEAGQVTDVPLPVANLPPGDSPFGEHSVQDVATPLGAAEKT